ncbi:PTS sugar transporter subunit IIA [Pararhodobacter aggregans]|uniref:PTS lactose transporter subunit IIC n=1 Tax=Pararhodobacter aggregans TaxID=404875 RepID=A0A2T7UTV2_9RHOB|nr:PTS sugar transporter subunit IIA [Pararhodobacter aggregans]PTX02865.1 phosphotransferase IIA-like nitrogen-regulatory protein PtsN [Pararhodobacter aggregans]PVE48084.1 PTS lactose transporter subunit IIC [Pararhodobacter aggregans]
MELAHLLTPGAIRVCNAVKSKKRLFQDLAETAAAAHGLDEAVAIDALQERESLGPTGVGHGVALPHARIDGIERVRGVFIRLDRPLDYGSVDRAPVDLVFALFAPRDAGVEHLKALALVSRTLRDPAVCAKLRANEETDKLFAILTQQTDTKAA